jgi:hypothetical protein
MVQCLHWPNTFPYFPFHRQRRKFAEQTPRKMEAGRCTLAQYGPIPAYRLATSKSILQARNTGLKLPLLLGNSQSLKRSHSFPFRRQRRECVSQTPRNASKLAPSVPRLPHSESTLSGSVPIPYLFSILLNTSLRRGDIRLPGNMYGWFSNWIQ